MQIAQPRPVTAKFDGSKKPLGFAGSRAMRSDQNSTQYTQEAKTANNFFKETSAENFRPAENRYRTKSSGTLVNKKLRELVSKKNLWAYDNTAANKSAQKKKSQTQLETKKVSNTRPTIEI